MPKTDRKDKLERFVEEYLVDLNATQAYLRSHPGVTDATARTEGSRLLANPNVQEAIGTAKAARSKRTQVSMDRVIRELARIAFADVRNYAEWGPNGVVLIDSGSLTTSQARAISEVTESVSDSSGKGGESHSVSRRVKLHNKVKALEILREHCKTTDGDGKSLAESFADLAAEAAEWEKNGGGDE